MSFVLLTFIIKKGFDRNVYHKDENFRMYTKGQKQDEVLCFYPQRDGTYVAYHLLERQFGTRRYAADNNSDILPVGRDNNFYDEQPDGTFRNRIDPLPYKWDDRWKKDFVPVGRNNNFYDEQPDGTFRNGTDELDPLPYKWNTWNEDFIPINDQGVFCYPRGNGTFVATDGQLHSINKDGNLQLIEGASHVRQPVDHYAPGPSDDMDVD